MSNVTCDVTTSIDGFVAGPNQSQANPIGERGELLHRWMLEQPLLLGKGERLFEGVGDLQLEPLDVSGSKLVAHLTYRCSRAAG
jgi:hypothetical protein